MTCQRRGLGKHEFVVSVAGIVPWLTGLMSTKLRHLRNSDPGLEPYITGTAAVRCAHSLLGVRRWTKGLADVVQQFGLFAIELRRGLAGKKFHQPILDALANSHVATVLLTKLTEIAAGPCRCRRDATWRWNPFRLSGC